MRAILVAGEIALSLVLLVAAGLTVRSFIQVQRVSSGFDPDRRADGGHRACRRRATTPAQRAEFWERAFEAVRQVPGIQRAAAISRLPLLPGNSTRGLAIKDVPPNVQATANYRTASPDYFGVMGIPLLRGRIFEDADREGRPMVAIVSSSMAQRYWPGRDPIGQHFQIDVPGPDTRSWASSATFAPLRSSSRRSRRSTCRTVRMPFRP